VSERLVLQGVHTHIGRYHILQGVDFDAPAGRTTMLLGRNGAGKTTCLRTIMGLWRASRGAINLGDVAITALPRDDGGVLRSQRQGESAAGRSRGSARR
jgi:branched-chain amino acid transport system ATP-binding protein